MTCSLEWFWIQSRVRNRFRLLLDQLYWQVEWAGLFKPLMHKAYRFKSGLTLFLCHCKALLFDGTQHCGSPSLPSRFAVKILSIQGEMRTLFYRLQKSILACIIKKDAGGGARTHKVLVHWLIRSQLRFPISPRPLFFKKHRGGGSGDLHPPRLDQSVFLCTEKIKAKNQSGIASSPFGSWLFCFGISIPRGAYLVF